MPLGLSWSWSGRSWSAQGGSWSLGLPWSWSASKPTLPAWERGLRHSVCAGPRLSGKDGFATRSVPLGLSWSWPAFVLDDKAPLPAWTGPNCSQLAFCANPSSQHSSAKSRVAENKFTRSIATCHIGKGVLGMVTARRILLDSLVGAKVLVPQNWWVNASTGKHLKGSKLWKGEIVCIDCTSPGQPLLFFECCEEDSDGPYPMQVSDFLKFWDRPMGRLPRGGALFPRQADGV